MPSFENDPDFNWKQISSMGIAPKETFTKPNNPIPRTALDLYVGIPPSHYRLGIAIDGMEVISNAIQFRIKAFDRNVVGWWFEENTSFNLKVSDCEWQYTEIVNILKDKQIQELNNWINNKKSGLLAIATEYEKHGRQFHHFLYDTIALIKAMEKNTDSEISNLMNDTNSALTLLHNRILAEVYEQYRDKKGNTILFPDNHSTGKKPDLHINGIYADIKTILITGKDRKQLINDFVIKLRKDILEKEEIKEQIGHGGSLFVGVWSPVINSILLAAFEKKQQFSTSIPDIEPHKIVFVLPSQFAFRNNYLIFDINDVCSILEDLANNQYDAILERDATTYLRLTNIRTGCPITTTSNSPSFPVDIG